MKTGTPYFFSPPMSREYDISKFDISICPTPRGLGGGRCGHPPRQGLGAPTLAKELGELSGQLDVMGTLCGLGDWESFCM